MPRRIRALCAISNSPLYNGDLEVIQVMVVELLLFLLHLQNNVLMVMLLLKEVEIVLTEITMLII